MHLCLLTGLSSTTRLEDLHPLAGPSTCQTLSKYIRTFCCFIRNLEARLGELDAQGEAEAAAAAQLALAEEDASAARTAGDAARATFEEARSALERAERELSARRETLQAMRGGAQGGRSAEQMQEAVAEALRQQVG